MFRDSLDEKDSAVAFGAKQQGQRRHRRHRPRRHHHPSQEMKRCSTWTASGQTDATATLGSDDDLDNNEARLRSGSVGSSTDCSETAETGCRGCAEGKEVLVREQQTRKAAGVSSLLVEHETATAASCTGGNERLTEEPVVRVSELPDVCAICLGQYATGEEVHVLPCLHIFHAEVKYDFSCLRSSAVTNAFTTTAQRINRPSGSDVRLTPLHPSARARASSTARNLENNDRNVSKYYSA